MIQPNFLTLDHVLRLHAYQVEQYGGSRQILDLGKIESAIAQPRQGFAGQFVHEDLAAMAVAYLFHIVQAHGFDDFKRGSHSVSAPEIKRQYPETT